MERSAATLRFAVTIGTLWTAEGACRIKWYLFIATYLILYKSLRCVEWGIKRRDTRYKIQLKLPRRHFISLAWAKIYSDHQRWQPDQVLLDFEVMKNMQMDLIVSGTRAKDIEGELTAFRLMERQNRLKLNRLVWDTTEKVKTCSVG